MIEEVEGTQPRDNQTSAPAPRRLEDLGTSENPIVLGVSPVEQRNSNEHTHTRGRANGTLRLTSRRKCPLGAYVEIIDELRPSHQLQSNNNRGSTTTNAASIPPINLRGEPVESTSIDAQVPLLSSENESTTGSTTTSNSNVGAGNTLCVPASFEILMRCSICMEIFHNPANVIPCNHKFCYSCLLSWKRTNQAAVCPQCRGPIHSMQKDPQFNEVVESFLTANPSKRRSATELEALDAVETECLAYQGGGMRGRRRGSTPQPRSRVSRDRTIRSPLVVRVSQIRAHRSPLTARQRGHHGIMEWFGI
ncbi:hypothetical protein RB195_011949 [Necator americanus]|uniref:RING-type domain-containing protein n=1 Tax=Necator americanus TaxID=51031 RepID=A0ABR1D6E3_NECAM